MSPVKRFGLLLNTIPSDNQLGLILQFGSGLPLTITGSRDLNLGGTSGDRPLFEPRNSLNLPTRWNVDMRYSRFYTLRGNRRISVQAGFKNLFKLEAGSAPAISTPTTHRRPRGGGRPRRRGPPGAPSSSIHPE